MAQQNFKLKQFNYRGQSSAPQLRLIPLGGIGDVTKNMYVYEFGQDIIVVDCGIGFPDEGMPGIDLVIPDASYLFERKKQVRGIVITHAHDDHIGGLPFIWPSLEVPIYAQRLAAAFIKNKFTEHHLPEFQIHTVDIKTKLDLGPFRVSFYQVSHSVPDSTGLIIETPAGHIIHQSDFKLDWTPLNGQITEIGKIALAAEKGIKLMLIDSLGVEKPGYSLTERAIQPTFEAIERKTRGKMLITTTSSNISRIQQAINVAALSGRKVALIGRSMDSNFQVARDLGYLQVSPGAIIAPDEVKQFQPHKLLLLVAGSQGQPGSALSRVANNDHKQVSLKLGDAVVFSADPIPGSETAQYSLIDQLTKMGVDVYYTALTDALHVSGHETAEEIKVMLGVVRPEFLMPIGATRRHMKAFADLAVEMGWQRDRVMLPDDGQVVNITPQNVALNGKIDVKNIYVDGLGVGDVGTVVLRDRKVMAEEGVVLVVVPADMHTSQLAGEIDVVSRGFIFERENEGLLAAAKQVVSKVLESHQGAELDWRFIRRHIEEDLQRFFYEKTQRRPMIITQVVEV